MLNITIKTIPHKQQRYDTVGDWYWKKDCLHIRISKMSDWRYEFLIAIHELTEVFLCKFSGVTQKQVDKFDTVFEKRRKPRNFDEPGDDYKAPYRIQHCIASGVERIIGGFLRVSWNDYADEVDAL